MDPKQPVGPPVDTTPARPPEPVTLSGRFGSVARLDPARDAADLWRAFNGHDHIWTYISRHGPFSDEATFAAWLAERATLNDPYAFTVRDPDGRALGLLALLEIRPAMRVIEVGFIVYSPALQRTALATETQRRFVEVDMKSEDVIYHGSCVRVSNNNARGWMLRDQLNNYRRNLSEMAKSMTRHIKNNSPRISPHHVSPILKCPA
jgi:hypothetical protein